MDPQHEHDARMHDMQPAQEEEMSELLYSVGGEHAIQEIDKSAQWVKLTQQEYTDFIHYLRDQKYERVICVGQGETTTPINHKDLTLSARQSSVPAQPALDGSWLLVENTAESNAFVAQNPNLQKKPSFWVNWPSFGVYDKISVVLKYTGAAFAFGYIAGAKAALDSLYSLGRHPAVATGVGVATAFGVSMAPQLFLKACGYIIVGGFLGASAVATPVLVIGTSGVFVAAGVYHSYQVAKRAAVRMTAQV